MLAEYLIEHGVELQLIGEKLRVTTCKPLTDDQRKFIKLNKDQIVSELKAANDETEKRYAYYFKLADGEGGGTWLSCLPPEPAIRHLKSFYIGREIDEFALIN